MRFPQSAFGFRNPKLDDHRDFFGISFMRALCKRHLVPQHKLLAAEFASHLTLCPLFFLLKPAFIPRLSIPPFRKSQQLLDVFPRWYGISLLSFFFLVCSPPPFLFLSLKKKPMRQTMDWSAMPVRFSRTRLSMFYSSAFP
jgi:hypothetical protein